MQVRQEESSPWLQGGKKGRKGEGSKYDARRGPLTSCVHAKTHDGEGGARKCWEIQRERDKETRE